MNFLTKLFIIAGSQCETNKVDSNDTMFTFFWIQNAIGAALFLGIAIAALVQMKFLAEQKRKINRNNFVSLPPDYQSDSTSEYVLHIAHFHVCRQTGYFSFWLPSLDSVRYQDPKLWSTNAIIIERVLYLMLDPYRYRGIIGAGNKEVISVRWDLTNEKFLVAEAILFGLATWGFVCIYLIIIVIWYVIETHTTDGRSH